ncbi:propanediol utilization protein [Candidatus Kuenenbacteria bacterium]|nr:propanediol utilization protein [Candidatus Kuenenbacteria bacterium]
MNVKIEVSARHAHFTQHDLEVLFGEGYDLKKQKDLSSGEYTSSDVVKLVGSKTTLENVRVVGPCKIHTQIEVSKSDAYRLGLNAPLRLSGKVIRSGPVKVVGPKGELELEEGLIVPMRHLKVDPDRASELNLNNAQKIKVKIEGPRALIFDEVEVRVKEDYDFAIVIDTDEANASGISSGGEGEVIV